MNYSITLLWHRVLYSMQHSVERVDSTEKWKQTCRNPCALASEPINRCMDSINRCMETPINRCMDSINRGTETPINRCTWITWIDAWKQLSMSKQMSGNSYVQEYNVIRVRSQAHPSIDAWKQMHARKHLMFKEYNVQGYKVQTLT